MENDKKRVQFIDSTYMIEEMILQFDDSNVAANNSLKEFEEIVAQLKIIEKPNEVITQLIKFYDEKISAVKEAIRKNTYRCECLKPALLLLQHSQLGADQNIRYIISMLLEATGVVNNDAVPFEKRTELKQEEPKNEGSTEQKETAKA